MLISRVDSCWPQATDSLPFPGAGWRTTSLSTAEEMAAILDGMVAIMASLNYTDQDIFGARLALEEAIVNAIKHGHRNDPTKVVEVRYEIGADYFVAEVEDQGAGFDPAQVPDPTAAEYLERPCGRGLLLIRHYSTWVRFNPWGNCVTFCICRSESASTD